MRKISSGLIYFLIVLSLVGVIDSAYLTSKHYGEDVVVCALGEESSKLDTCDSVTTSEYSEVFGIPVAVLGLLYYLTTLFGLVFLLYFPKKALLALLGCITGAGTLWSLWFVYVQFFILRSVCVYCMASAITTFILFTVLLALALKSR